MDENKKKDLLKYIKLKRAEENDKSIEMVKDITEKFLKKESAKKGNKYNSE